MDLAMNRIILNVMNIDNLRKPRVVFVTRPHAIKIAYAYFLAPTCCNGTVKEKIFENDIVLEGILEKKVDFSKWLDYFEAPIQRHRALQCNIECHTPGTSSHG